MVDLVFDRGIPLCGLSLGDTNFSAFELEAKAKEHIQKIYGFVPFDFYLVHNGKLLSDKETIEGCIHIIPRLRGGKGGFGSMLRAIGAQIEKTTNREACRDLSGRRLRDINEEKRLKKWIAEQAEREQEALERKRKKLEKLNEIVKHDFKDEDYTKARLEMPEKIHESVEEGLKAAIEEPSTSVEVDHHIKVVEPPKKKKPKRKLWVDDLLDESASDSESEGESPAKKIKQS